MTTARLITSIKTNFNLIADPSAKSPQANRAIPSTGTALTRFLTCMAPVIGKRFSTLSHKIYIYICTCIYILVLCCPNHFHSQNKEFKRFSLATCCPDWCVLPLFTLSRDSLHLIFIGCATRLIGIVLTFLWQLLILVRTFIIYEWCSCLCCGISSLTFASKLSA